MPTGLRERLRAALSAALRERDGARVAVLRTTLAALDNAAAVPAAEHEPGSLALEATPVGVGAREGEAPVLAPRPVVAGVGGGPRHPALRLLGVARRERV